MRPRIIAVFGQSHHSASKRHPDERPEILVPPDVLDCARRFGACIASEGHILLTGGDGSPKDPEKQSVKDAAIEGARSRQGTWIGILKEPEYGGSHPQHVIATGLGDRRNFLEALMCDAAIAFHGGDGTYSEVACAFALQRRLALIGREWRKHFFLDGDDGDARAQAVLKRGAGYLKADRNDYPFTLPIAEYLQPERGPALRKAAQEAASYGYSNLPISDAHVRELVGWAAGAGRR